MFGAGRPQICASHRKGKENENEKEITHNRNSVGKRRALDFRITGSGGRYLAGCRRWHWSWVVAVGRSHWWRLGGAAPSVCLPTACLLRTPTAAMLARVSRNLRRIRRIRGLRAQEILSVTGRPFIAVI